MKVFEINSVCGTGSTGRIVCDIKDMLNAGGDQCRIAYGRGYYNDPDCFKIESDLVFKSHVFFSRFTDRQGFYSTAATRRLVRDIENYQPDIIHLHNIHGYYLDIRVLFDFLIEYNRPVVWTLHDCWAFTGHCAYFSFAGCDKWKTECKQCPQKTAYPASVLIDNSKKAFSEKKTYFTSVKNLNIVTPSNWLNGIVKESFLKNFPVTTIYNGIDLNVFKYTESDFKIKNNLSHKKIVLGVANVWEKRKGLDDFIALSKILPIEYKIVLVGLTDKQIAELPTNIMGISRTGNLKELVEIYSAADVYVNTSVEETMGLTTVEALACGTPAVVYDATAVPEVVDEKSGRIVAAGDVNALLDAILKLKVNADDCVQRAKDFEKNKQYQKYIDLYNKILGGDC